jgi:hypothetical protein
MPLVLRHGTLGSDSSCNGKAFKPILKRKVVGNNGYELTRDEFYLARPKAIQSGVLSTYPNTHNATTDRGKCCDHVRLKLEFVGTQRRG